MLVLVAPAALAALAAHHGAPAHVDLAALVGRVDLAALVGRVVLAARPVLVVHVVRPAALADHAAPATLAHAHALLGLRRNEADIPSVTSPRKPRPWPI